MAKKSVKSGDERRSRKQPLTAADVRKLVETFGRYIAELNAMADNLEDLKKNGVKNIVVDGMAKSGDALDQLGIFIGNANSEISKARLRHP